MDEKRKTRAMGKTAGWLLVVLGVLWALSVFMASQREGAPISYTLGAMTWPILVSVLGLYFAGVIKKAK